MREKSNLIEHLRERNKERKGKRGWRLENQNLVLLKFFYKKESIFGYLLMKAVERAS